MTSEQQADIPEFPDWLCLEWSDGRRIRVAMTDIPEVIEVIKKVAPSHAIPHEHFGSFIASLIAYVHERAEDER